MFDSLIQVYVLQIQVGNITIDKIPKRFQNDVQNLLNKDGQ